MTVLPNAERGEFVVKIGDRELLMAPDFDRIAKAETVLGRSLVQLGGEIAIGAVPTLAQTAGVFAAFIVKPEMSREEVGRLLARVGYRGYDASLADIVERVIYGKDGPPSREDGADESGNVEGGGSSDE